MSLSALRDFFRLESSAGILLVLAAMVAIIVDNSPLAPYYDTLLTLPAGIRVGPVGLSKPLLLWVNDGLMAIFFLLVTLEIKREVLDGELSTKAQIMLPAVAAIGGMALPAAIFIGINRHDPVALAGWAVPTATDIAFALGVMSLLGSRVPTALKVLLTAIAIIDDLGAIVIIAIFYTAQLSVLSLALASAALIVLALLNRLRVVRLAPYLLVGLLLWVFVLKSGVHATLAGVAIGLAIPMAGKEGAAPGPLRHLEHILHPWVAYGILPLFAFANAGVSLGGFGWAALVDPLSIGVALALFAGKQIGVFGGLALALATRLAHRSRTTNWQGLYGMSLLTGIGFTMSLFIASLAFADPEHVNAVRLGILLGSFASGALGYLMLARAYPRR